MSSETKNVVVLALSVGGILVLLGLIIWGLNIAFQRSGAAKPAQTPPAASAGLAAPGAPNAPTGPAADSGR